ncbi:caspase family protein [Vibrio cholerae]|nr:caspase family protein [Vibrio cholerae]EJL6307564.1 caspase family protein [Vibrio cholerae]EJL6677246.1 caspase family protein [Vibrio cholerae]ELH0844928.1 caspase family protein [Vibrio cholerae]ELT7571636.1 caspase family protein [Vibrio cholerae]
MTALVIGNGAYPECQLKNATNDADDMSQKLLEFGFSVIKLTDATKKSIDESVNSFRDNLNSNEIGLFYFAGHGMQIEGENYITAVDSDFSTEIDAKYSSYPLNKIIEIMEKSENKTNIIILDACRNNPYLRAWNRDPSHEGLAPVHAPKGTIIAFSTSPGEVASDGAKRNGAYTQALLQHIATPDILIEDMFKRVRNSLTVLTKGRQTSWEHTSLSGDFFFNLSLGSSIGIYSKEAISDELFQIDASKLLHSEIYSLKSHNWYTQNVVASKLTVANLNDCDDDVAFVLGRNIYQAACGSARDISSYIQNFRERTTGVNGKTRKALLDGMLFEIFFNSKGQLRDNFKTSKFNSVFEFQKFSEFNESFAFISDVLSTYQNRFYAIPGKNREVSIDIEAKENDKGEFKVAGVYFSGFNILRPDERFPHYGDGEGISYEGIRASDFEKRISEETLIPSHKLKINYAFDCDSKTKLLVPYSYTVAK